MAEVMKQKDPYEELRLTPVQVPQLSLSNIPSHPTVHALPLPPQTIAPGSPFHENNSPLGSTAQTVSLICQPITGLE